MLELKVLIAYLLYNFEMKALESIKNVKLLQDMVITPMGPIKVKFIPKK